MTTAGKIAYFLAALLLGLSISIHFAAGFWGDQDWELLVAQMWLGGKRLYVDHVAVTPPLLFYLYALPVLLSRHFPFLQDYQALVGLSLLAVVAVILASVRLIAQHPGFGGSSTRMQFIVLLFFLLVFRVSPPFFGDREHIMAVLTLPYLLRWMPGLSRAAPSLRLRMALGLMAAIGFFIKPHCLLMFGAVQLITLVRTRSLAILRSPENLVIYAFGIVYGMIVWTFTPEYLTLILPLAWYTYSAVTGFPGGAGEMLTGLALTVILLRPRDRSPYHGDIAYFLALLPFTYLYARLNNGWSYAYLPLMTVLLLACGFVLWEFLYLRRSFARRAWRPLAGIALCLLNFAMETGLTLNYFGDVLALRCRGNAACPGYYQPFLNEIGIAPKARSFGTIGMDFALWTRVAKLSGAEWRTRFAQLWMLPRLYIADDAFYNGHIGIFYYVGNALAQDLQEKKPDLVFVEVSSTLYTIHMKKPIDWAADFSMVPDFKEAWKHYAYLHSIDNCGRFQPVEAAALRQPKTPGPGRRPEYTNCRYDVYRRVP